MTGLIPAVIPRLPPASHAGAPLGLPASSRHPLPLAGNVVAPRTRTQLYGLAAVDARGRIADRTIPETLCWRPGMRLSIAVVAGLVEVRADPEGSFAVSRYRHVLLPAFARRNVGLRSGDRVLLVADPDAQTLIVYPPAALDAMLTLCAPVPAGGQHD